MWKRFLLFISYINSKRMFCLKYCSISRIQNIWAIWIFSKDLEECENYLWFIGRRLTVMPVLSLLAINHCVYSVPLPLLWNSYHYRKIIHFEVNKVITVDLNNINTFDRIAKRGVTYMLKYIHFIKCICPLLHNSIVYEEWRLLLFHVLKPGALNSF